MSSLAHFVRCLSSFVVKLHKETKPQLTLTGLMTNPGGRAAQPPGRLIRRERGEEGGAARREEDC